MIVEVTLYKASDGVALDVYKTEAPNWRACVADIFSWLRIVVLPYWKYGELWLAPTYGTDHDAALALYGFGVAYGLVDQLDHDWLREPLPAHIAVGD